MESTLVLLKPDAVEKAVCGDIITRFERRGLKIIGMKMLKLSREQAKIHYGEHEGKDFLEELVDFVVSGPLLAMVIQGENAIKLVRTMMGSTKPLEAAPGTIRGDFATNVRRNVIHGSDCSESAEREIKFFFTDEEIYPRNLL